METSRGEAGLEKHRGCLCVCQAHWPCEGIHDKARFKEWKKKPSREARNVSPHEPPLGVSEGTSSPNSAPRVSPLSQEWLSKARLVNPLKGAVTPEAVHGRCVGFWDMLHSGSSLRGKSRRAAS